MFRDQGMQDAILSKIINHPGHSLERSNSVPPRDEDGRLQVFVAVDGPTNADNFLITHESGIQYYADGDRILFKNIDKEEFSGQQYYTAVKEILEDWMSGDTPVIQEAGVAELEPVSEPEPEPEPEPVMSEEEVESFVLNSSEAVTEGRSSFLLAYRWFGSHRSSLRQLNDALSRDSRVRAQIEACTDLVQQGNIKDLVILPSNYGFSLGFSVPYSVGSYNYFIRYWIDFNLNNYRKDPISISASPHDSDGNTIEMRGYFHPHCGAVDQESWTASVCRGNMTSVINSHATRLELSSMVFALLRVHRDYSPEGAFTNMENVELNMSAALG